MIAAAGRGGGDIRSSPGATCRATVPVLVVVLACFPLIPNTLSVLPARRRIYSVYHSDRYYIEDIVDSIERSLSDLFPNRLEYPEVLIFCR